jgi:hypothetical protein
MKHVRRSLVGEAAAAEEDSVAVEAVVQAESAIAGS